MFDIAVDHYINGMLTLAEIGKQELIMAKLQQLLCSKTCLINRYYTIGIKISLIITQESVLHTT
jgi:hypothetical protein